MFLGHPQFVEDIFGVHHPALLVAGFRV